jgi:hypothetical protein
MPTSVVRAYKAVLRGILVAVEDVEPGAAYERRIEKNVDFLAVVVGLGVEVAVS